MKKLCTKTLALLMAMGMTTSLVACGSKKDDKGLNTKGKEKISMSFYLGEFGEWAEDLAVEWSNQNDKYYIDAKSNMSLSNVIVNDIKSGSVYDIFITEDANFQTIYDDKYLEDLTDVFSSKVDGENGKTILEKVKDIDTLAPLISKNNKYYALPTSTSPVGMIFDYERFEKNGWLMLDENGEVTAGKDGKKGTYDDGQPQTMAEFKQMCEKIKQTTDDVFLYMGVVAGEYLNNLGYAYLAQYLGEEDYKIFREHQSNGKEVTLIDGTKRAFTIDEGYLSFHMDGVDDMFTFLAEYLTNSRYVSQSTLTDRSLNVDASHMKFIKVADNAPAFIVEGNWFENGSRMLMESNEKYGGKPFGTYDYRYMMIPNEKEGKNVVFSQTSGTLIVKKQAKAEKAEAIKDFLRFLYKNDTLARVTAEYGMMWNMEYTVEGAIREKMTKFISNAMEMVQDTDNIIVRGGFIDATVPIKSYSQLSTYAMMQSVNTQTSMFAMLKDNGYKPAEALKGVHEWNNPTKWSTYVAQARTYGFYPQN